MKYTYNEFQTYTTDFNDPKMVEAYDHSQLVSLDKERALVEELGIQAGETLIDYGAGTGAFAIAAAERCQQVTAVDTSEAMLRLIEQRKTEHGIPHIDTRHAGFISYQHAGAPVDWIVSKVAIHHLPDFWKAVALTRMRRHLKPGGKLYLHDVIYSFSPENSDSAFDTWIDQYLPSSNWPRSDFEIHIQEEYSTFAWIIEGLLRQTGYRILRADYRRCYGSILAVNEGTAPGTA